MWFNLLVLLAAAASIWAGYPEAYGFFIGCYLGRNAADLVLSKPDRRNAHNEG